MNVLSLFDGMSCGQIALRKLGVKVDNYYAAEIDKHAIKVTQHNFPNTIQLGDVTLVNGRDLPKIDLVIGGSPCQGFSFAGKQLAFDDPRSKLFFEFVRLLNEVRLVNPSVKFLLENVKMKKEFEIIISNYMGVAPIEINSALVSAQNRVRLYWTNINEKPYGLFGDMMADIPQPKDKGILLKDILETDVNEKYFLSEKAIKFVLSDMRLRKKYTQNATSAEKSLPHLAKNQTNWCGDFVVAMRGRGDNNEQQLEPRGDSKTNTITSVSKDNLVIQVNGSKESGGQQPFQQNRVYDVSGKMTALDTAANKKNILIPEATKKGFIEVKPGESFDFTMPDSKTRRGRLMEDKSNCLTAAKYDFMQYTNDYRIRRLTPTECKRLQTVPDDYDMTVVSDSQQYRMLGNGWTVDVISHIFSYLNQTNENQIEHRRTFKKGKNH